MLKLFRQAFAAFWEKHFATDCTTSPKKRAAVQLLQSGAELLDAPNASEIDHLRTIVLISYEELRPDLITYLRKLHGKEVFGDEEPLTWIQHFFEPTLTHALAYTHVPFVLPTKNNTLDLEVGQLTGTFTTDYPRALSVMLGVDKPTTDSRYFLQQGLRSLRAQGVSHEFANVLIFLLTQGPENIVFNAAIIPTNRFLQEQFQDHSFFSTPYADHEQDAQCYDKKLRVKSPTEVMLDFIVDYSTEKIKNAFPEYCPHYSPCLSVRFRVTIIFDENKLQVRTCVDFHPWHHTLVDAFKKVPTTPAVTPLKIPITFLPALDSSMPYLNLREPPKTPPRHPTPSPRKRLLPSPATALSHLQITPATTAQGSRQGKPASAPRTPSQLFSSQPKRVATGTSRALFTPTPGLP